MNPRRRLGIDVRLKACQIGLGIAAWAWATQVVGQGVEIIQMDTREAVLAGEMKDVSVDALGALRLAPGLQHLASLEEPFVFTAASAAGGWILGTGNAGQVARVAADGSTTILATLTEPEVFAVLGRKDGSVVAGSSPEGKVYRLQDGASEVVFEPQATYIWALAEDARGRLLVATGLPGKIFRVAKNGDSELLYDSPDRHVRALLPLADGSVLAGTAGQGLVLRIADNGSVTTLYDAAQPEVLAFAAGDGGTVYAALLASEASLVDVAKRAGEENGADNEAEAQITTVGTRSTAGYSGPRSLILQIDADGQVRELLGMQDETVHSLLWQRGGLWLGTGQEGRLYRFQDETLILERTLEESQIIGLQPADPGMAVITTSAAVLHHLTGQRAATGNYTSTVLDAGGVARFGTLRWRGDVPAGAEVSFLARAGMSAEPDPTWGDWTELKAPAGSREASLSAVGRARYVQWRAELKRGSSSDGPSLAAAEVAYRQENSKPEIASFEVLDPGQILVPNSFNASNHTFEPWSPNREGIFTSLRSETSKDEGRLKTLWKKGYRTLRWKAEDGNADELSYRLEFRPDSGEQWLPMVSELDETYHSFDASVLPDGVYRFRLTVSDDVDRPAGEGLSSHRLSPPVVIDHSPPRLVKSQRLDDAIEIELQDRWSPIREVMLSADAGEWQRLAAEDGLIDGVRERLRIPTSGDGHLLLLRVTDASFNVVTLNLLE